MAFSQIGRIMTMAVLLGSLAAVAVGQDGVSISWQRGQALSIKFASFPSLAIGI